MRLIPIRSDAEARVDHLLTANSNSSNRILRRYFGTVLRFLSFQKTFSWSLPVNEGVAALLCVPSHPLGLELVLHSYLSSTALEKEDKKILTLLSTRKMGFFGSSKCTTPCHVALLKREDAPYSSRVEHLSGCDVHAPCAAHAKHKRLGWGSWHIAQCKVGCKSLSFATSARRP